MSYLRLLFYKLFQKMTISGQKRQICELTLNFFCQFLRGPNEFASFCIWFSSGKTSSFKKSPNGQNLGVLKKVSFWFCLFCTENFNNVNSFCYHLEEKGLNYQVNTENKPKFKFLCPKNKWNQKSKIRVDCSSNFWRTPSNLPFWPKIVKYLKKRIK